MSSDQAVAFQMLHQKQSKQTPSWAPSKCEALCSNSTSKKMKPHLTA